MKDDIRNIYTALRFAERPDLHLTLRYYPKVVARGPRECELIQQIGVFWTARRPEAFTLTLGERAMFGPRRNIPVLLATGTWPTWIEPLRLVVPVPVKDAYAFRPHVTTPEEGPLALKVTSVAVMHKDTVLWEWML